MQWMRRRLLIWGTTYPEFSRKYYETVCTGAIDAETGRLIRIYPVTLRHLENRFRHYHWIEADIARNTSDRRPESYRINQDTITIGESVPTTDAWLARRDWVLRPDNVHASVNALLAAEARDGTCRGRGIDRGERDRFVCGVEVQRHGADRGCRAVLDGQGELVIDEAPEVEARVAPGVKFTRATERLPRAHLRATLARVVHEHDGDVIGALELG